MLKDSQVATLNSFLENSQDGAASDLKRTPPSVFYCEVVAADAKLRMLRFQVSVWNIIVACQLILI